MDPSDEFLVENFRKTHDSSSFKFLVLRYQSQLFSLAYRMIGNPEEAEEIVQESFMRVYAGIDQFHRSTSFNAWVLSITHNLCLDLLRVKQRRRSIRLLPLDPGSLHSDKTTNTVAEVADWSSDPANEVQATEQTQLIENTLYRLPAEQRAVVILHDIEGLSYQEIATVTGTNLGTVRSRLHYARLKLRMMLEPYFAGTQLAAAR